MKKQILPLSIIISSLIVLAGLLVQPNVQTHNRTKSITVVGDSQERQKNEIASFNAGVSVLNEDRQEAIEEVNSTIEEIIQNVKDFGIPDEDIQTENISIFQEEEPETREPSGWRVSNNISITLRNIDRAEELADLLSQSGATNVYGPSFRLDETEQNKNELYVSALENAKEKAEGMANSLDARVGRAIHITEGQSSSTPMLMQESRDLGGGGTSLEPGSSSVSVSVTVVYELNY